MFFIILTVKDFFYHYLYIKVEAIRRGLSKILPIELLAVFNWQVTYLYDDNSLKFALSASRPGYNYSYSGNGIVGMW